MSVTSMEETATATDETIRRYVSRQVWHPGLGARTAPATVADVTTKDGSMTLLLEGGMRVAVEGAVLLPWVGQTVRLSTGGQDPVIGAFLGVVGVVWEDEQWRLRGAVMLHGGVETFTLSPQAWAADPEGHDDGFTGVTLPAALAALAESVTKGAREMEARERWIEDTTSDAHAYANDNDLCQRFDEFMESVGLRGRTQDRTLTVQVSFDLEVETPYDADPEDHISQEAVRAALSEVLERADNGYGISYEVTDTDY